jgi:hypothetical protein
MGLIAKSDCAIESLASRQKQLKGNINLKEIENRGIMTKSTAIMNLLELLRLV